MGRDTNKGHRDRASESKKILEEIKKYGNLSAELSAEIQVKLNEVKTQSTTISSSEKDINETESQIAQILVKVQSQQEEVNNLNLEATQFFEDSFKPFQKEFNDPNVGVEALGGQIKNKHSQISELETSAQSIHSELTKYLDDCNKIYTDFQKIQESIDKLFEEATNEETGLKSKLENVTDFRDKVKTLYNEVKESHRISNEWKNEIEKFKTDSETNLTQIIKDSKNSTNYSDKIKALYDISQSNLTGGIFDQTRKEYDRAQLRWLYILISVIGATVIVAWALTPSAEELRGMSTDFLNFILKYAVLSPLIYLFVFSARQYKVARLSLEKYTFKTVMSVSLEGKIQYMMEHFNSENDDKILDFALNNLERLYDEPYFDEAIKMKYKLQQDHIRFGSESANFSNPNQAEKEIKEDQQEDSITESDSATNDTPPQDD